MEDAPLTGHKGRVIMGYVLAEGRAFAFPNKEFSWN